MSVTNANSPKDPLFCLNSLGFTTVFLIDYDFEFEPISESLDDLMRGVSTGPLTLLIYIADSVILAFCFNGEIVFHLSNLFSTDLVGIIFGFRLGGEDAYVFVSFVNQVV